MGRAVVTIVRLSRLVGAPLRKIAELLADATAAGSEDERERCLQAAAGQASNFHDWDEILRNLPPSLPPETRLRLLARSLECAERREEIWGFRNAAVVYARQLSDANAARATLHLGEQLLIRRGEGALGYEWGVLADGFVAALADKDEARRLLEAGWLLAWSARDVENLGRIVNQWAKLLDAGEARQRLEQVEAAARQWGDPGGVIYWWHALGCHEAGRRARQWTLESTTRFSVVLDLVRYWHLYEKDSPGIEEALARAQLLADSAAEWLELAEVLRGKPDDDGLLRRALDCAANRAGEAADLKVRIAAAYVAWFGDEAAADRVGPRGISPAQLRGAADPLPGWEGSPSALFERLCARLSDENLAHIAAADYGQDQERHRAALAYIRDTRLVPLRMAWHPGEVVELTRWSSGDEVDHLERAFCCTLLLLLVSSDDDLANTGPIFVESCLSLGEADALDGERLLVWRLQTDDSGDTTLLLVLLSILRGARHPEDPRLTELAARINACDEAHGLRQRMAESLRPELWEALIAKMDPALFPLVCSQRP